LQTAYNIEVKFVANVEKKEVLTLKSRFIKTTRNKPGGAGHRV
jgi:hypothetical protein